MEGMLGAKRGEGILNGGDPTIRKTPGKGVIPAFTLRQ